MVMVKAKERCLTMAAQHKTLPRRADTPIRIRTMALFLELRLTAKTIILTIFLFSMEISDELYNRLNELGIIPNDVRSGNIGTSDYSRHLIQPWAIWQEYNLNPWDADIVKRVLRNKIGDTRRMDYEKIIHICKERLRQLGY